MRKRRDRIGRMHESGHLYLEMLRSLASSENAPEEIRSLWGQAKIALGVTMRRCLIRNWGHSYRFDTRAFGAWAHLGGRIHAESCVFWQDRLWHGFWHWIRDFIGHVGQCFNGGRFGLRDLFMPGTWRGLTAGPGGMVSAEFCYRNNRRIQIEGHKGPWMPEPYAMELVARLEALRR